MYTEFYGLNDFPFRLTSDTEYLFMSTAHSRAKAYMDYAIFNREGFVVITGEIGSGKTTLVKKLLSELEDDVLVAKIFQTQLDEVELLQAILVEFGLNPFSARKVELLNMLNQFLVNSFLEGKRILLIIDDAQNLKKRVLEEITMLSGLETQKEKILHIILVGQPELNKTLESPDMEQLLQRVSLRYHVRALIKEEVSKYIKHRLKVAGVDREIFKEDTIDDIFEYTGGVPRLINTLCDTALTCAFADDFKTVTNDVMKSALDELQWKKFNELKEDKKLKNEELFRMELLDSLHNEGDIPASIEQNYSPIASRALVEIYRQLERIANIMEKGTK